jgi:hypothetical protein
VTGEASRDLQLGHQISPILDEKTARALSSANGCKTERVTSISENPVKLRSKISSSHFLKKS